jgi:hypothetical protein
MPEFSTTEVHFPAGGAHAACACHDLAAEFNFDGKEFVGQFNGSITTRIGQPSVDSAGLVTLPLIIVGYSTTSEIEGFGRTTLDFDFSRPIQHSYVKGNDPGTTFPGVQTMYLNILLTTDAIPGVTLRSRRRGTLINNKVTGFPPPPGSTYALQRPVEFEDIREPGRVRLRLMNINTSIVSSDVTLREIYVGRGLYLYPPQDSFVKVLNKFSPQTPIAFRMAEQGMVTVNILNRQGHKVLTVLNEEKAAGEHRVSFDGRLLRGQEYYYQIQVNGENRTAKMLLMRR